jgi:hypothetical protein
MLGALWCAAEEAKLKAGDGGGDGSTMMSSVPSTHPAGSVGDGVDWHGGSEWMTTEQYCKLRQTERGDHIEGGIDDYLRKKREEQKEFRERYGLP